MATFRIKTVRAGVLDYPQDYSLSKGARTFDLRQVLALFLYIVGERFHLGYPEIAVRIPKNKVSKSNTPDNFLIWLERNLSVWFVPPTFQLDLNIDFIINS